MAHNNRSLTSSVSAYKRPGIGTNYQTPDMQFPSLGELTTALVDQPVNPTLDARLPYSVENISVQLLASALPAVPARIRMRSLDGTDWNRPSVSVAIRYVREALLRVIPQTVDQSSHDALGGFRIMPVAKHDGKATHVYLMDPQNGVRASLAIPEFRKEEAPIVVRLADMDMPLYENIDPLDIADTSDVCRSTCLAVRKALNCIPKNNHQPLMAPTWTTTTPRQARGFLVRALKALSENGSLSRAAAVAETPTASVTYAKKNDSFSSDDTLQDSMPLAA